MINVPILLTVFNRPEETRQVFNKIRKIKPKRMFIAADGPRRAHSQDLEKCREVREIVKNIDWDCEVETLFRESNLGCKIAMSTAIDWFFENVEEGIILEDDCLPENSFFQFCEEMLTQYREDKRVMMVSGTNYLLEIPEFTESYFFSRYYAIWGWATWKRAWKLYDRDLFNWPDFKKNRYLQHVYDLKTAFQYTFMFQKAYENKIDTWDIAWLYTCIINGGLAIVPKNNLISNIAVTGTRQGKSKGGFLNMPTKPLDVKRITHPALVLPSRELDKRIYRKVFPLWLVVRNIFVNLSKRFLKP